MTGRLVLVATPIGHLGDLSPRATAALADAAAVVCEDTRRTGRLLVHAGVSGKRLLVANEHTEASCAAQVRELLDGGATVAVVTDAGTPGISDPGERLVRAAIDGGHVVEAVPGASALLAALVVSGLPTDRFVMEGFLPRQGRDRTDRIAEVAREPRTVVLYEAPHRLARTLADLADACGPDRPVAVARELLTRRGFAHVTFAPADANASPPAQLAELRAGGDWVAYYLALRYEVDPASTDTQSWLRLKLGVAGDPAR